MSETTRQKSKLIRPTALIICDLVMLEVAFLATYWFRFHCGLWPVPLGIPPLESYLLASGVVLLVFFGLFYTSGMYAMRAGLGIEEELTGLFKGVVLGSLLVLALTFFFRRMTYSRSFFGLFFLSCFFFLTLGRVLARLWLRHVLRRGLGTTRMLLVGENPMRERILRAARELPGLGLVPVGWLSIAGEDPGRPAGAASRSPAGAVSVPVPGGEATAAGTRAQSEPATLPARSRPLDIRPDSPLPRPSAEPDELPCLGRLEDIAAVSRAHEVDLVVLTLPFEELARIASIAAQLSDLNIQLQFVPDLLALQISRMRLTEIAGIPFISVREVALSGADRIVKRTFDLACSLVALIVLSPLLGLLALLVKLSSRGPVFHQQLRLGRDGREFEMLKFRTMRQDAEAATGPTWTVAHDPRRTRLGIFLRRFSLDELPQLWNVLRGDMSLVGPRPERRHFVDQFRQQMPRYFERHRVRSGLTGWAQVHGLRGDSSVLDRTLYDLHYVENWSLAMDVKIILMTIHHVIRGENAY